MADFYNTVGANNRNLLVQSKRLAPYHEDITVRQGFEPKDVAPGQYTKIKLDLKHANDREIILNDIRLRFALDFSARATTGGTATPVGTVMCVRGTDLIREMTIKINEDIVFKVDKRHELTHLWLMNNHRLGGEKPDVNDAYLMNAGVLPAGFCPPLFYNSTDKGWHFSSSQTVDTTNKVSSTNIERWTQPGLERHDGLPRIVYTDDVTTGGWANYKYYFDMSLNQLVGPIFHRLHLRRIEFVQIELMFEPWVSSADTQNFLLFCKNPTRNGSTGTEDIPHPYSVAKYVDVEIRQYRTTLLDGIQGFTLPDNRMLSWLMHRYSRREYTVKFSETDKTNVFVDVKLNDWEIRTNITRLYWMLAPANPYPAAGANGFQPFAAPCEPYDQLMGVEVRWKNDIVLDLDTVFQVYRHYILSENKRYSLQDPYVRFQRLLPKDAVDTEIDNDITYYTWNEDNRVVTNIGHENYEMPVYHVDLNMNIMNGSAGAEIVGGIVNDTADYVIRIKGVWRDEKTRKLSTFHNTTDRKLYVWIEYQTLVNLAAGSSQFNRGSQTISKQLNTP